MAKTTTVAQLPSTRSSDRTTGPGGLLRTARRLALPAYDAAAWLVAVPAATLFRFEGDLTAVDTRGLLQVVLITLVAHAIVAPALHLYRGGHWAGSVDEAVGVTATVGLVGAISFVTVLVPALPPVPRSVPLAAGLIALVLSVAARVAIRLGQERSTRRGAGTARRVIVLGAGPEGRQLVRSMMVEPGSGYLPVALLDDDPESRRRRISGISVRGTRHDIREVAGATRADLLVVAVHGLDPADLLEINRTATAAGIAVKVLPSLGELLCPGVGIAELLGRQTVEIDVAVVAAYLTGRRVLVTGAGGSIGSELCRQIHRFGPAELLMLDHDESGLHATQLSMHGRASLDSSDVVLADIREAGVLADIFADRRPEVVFHAAALKHLTMLEQYPDEAWKTNVTGTQNVLDAARRAGVRTFVNISTDKAVDPVSVLGRSKRIGERLVADTAAHADGTYVSVRFGNVLGSRGSVLTTFTEQIAAGGPITVTHPDVTRFFMTIPEAAQLVVHAAAIGRPGEALVLDMGTPVRIEDVARHMMELSGRSVPIVHTGLRPGEKLHESLFGPGERDHRPIHPAVSHVDVPALPVSWAQEHADLVGSRQAMIDLPLFPHPEPADRAVDAVLVPFDRQLS